MRHLLLVGGGRGLMEVAARLHAEAHVVILAPDLAQLDRPMFPPVDLMIAEITGGDDPTAVGEAARKLAIPWLAYNSTPDPAATHAAYREGALAVLPADTSTDVVRRTVGRLLASQGPHPQAGGDGSNSRHRWQKHFRAGERILLDEGSALEVETGVVALTVIHDDGTEVLLGLYGPGQILAGHPDDSCCIQLYAHTESKVRIQSWLECTRLPGFSERLRDRLRQMEAWAAMQARPQIEQRLLGILSLLAEQFGRATPQGAVIEVRITHSQLAAAIGATRATVTRRVGVLRRRGVLAVTGYGSNERYCLQGWAGQTHASAAGQAVPDAGWRRGVG